MEGAAELVKDNAKDLLVLVKDQLKYACCFNSYVEELKMERENLDAKIEDVDDVVGHYKKQQKRIPKAMKKWVEDAKKDIAEVDELLKKARTKKNCLPYCPNWFYRWYLGSKLEDKKGDVEKRIEKGNQYPALDRATTLRSGRTLDFLGCENYLEFEGRKDDFEKLKKAVNDDKVRMIGLYGMGGCGKTFMAAQVEKMAVAEDLFHKVLFVRVSKEAKVGRVQEKLASALSYDFLTAEKEESERANRLHTILTEENNILLILDDVWQQLNFGAIGIPSGLKVLITTRDRNVCVRMGCQSEIGLQVLDNDDAWKLFQKQAGISESGTSGTIKHLARQISDECKGLPVALDAVASTLKGKAEADWDVALTRLRESKPVNIEVDDDEKNPYKCLRVSYDYLGDDQQEAKSLLLLCSVFPEYNEIPLEHLTRIAIGLGVVRNTNGTYESKRKEVIAAKDKLVRCSLLLDVDNGKRVKMHDLVRDVVRWIAKDEKKAIMYKLENHVTTLEGHNSSSIKYLVCDKFPNKIHCSNLDFLHIDTDELEVPDQVFQRMGNLRILLLSNSRDSRSSLSTIPFRSLAKLRYLFLKNWHLSDLSFLGDMEELEGLVLDDCSFRELPNEVAQLTKLRLLNLNRCNMERDIFERIRQLTQLKELYISASYDRNPEDLELELQRFGINLGTKFSMDVDEDTGQRILCLDRFHTSDKAIKSLAEKANVLCLANIEGGLTKFVPDILKSEGGSLSQLIELWLCDSDEIEYLVDNSSNQWSQIGTLFSKLAKLKIESMKNLRALWHGHLPPGGHFDKLEELSLTSCPELTSLFTSSYLLQLESNQFEHLSEITPTTISQRGNNLNSGSFTLTCLTRLRLSSCAKLGSLFTISIAKTLTILEELSIQDCPNLKHILETLLIKSGGHDFNSEVSMFPSLKTLLIRRCGSLQYVFPIFFVGVAINKLDDRKNCYDVFPNLIELSVEDCEQLVHVFEPSHLHNPKNEEIYVNFPALERLSLMTLPTLISIFPNNSLHLTWPSLNKFNLYGCPELRKDSLIDFMVSSNSRKLVSANNKDIRRTQKHFHTPKPPYKQNSRLKTIFCNCGHQTIGQEVSSELDWESQPQMSDICVDLSFQNLQELRIQGCGKLEVIIPASVLRCLPELKWLEISECEELKQIIDEGEMEIENLSNPISAHPQQCFPKLQTLIIEKCHKLKRLFSASTSNDLPNLEVLFIIGASELEELTGSKIELPKLKYSIFAHLPRLSQRIELKTAVGHHLVRYCPNLSGNSTVTTYSEFVKEISAQRDLGIKSWMRIRPLLFHQLYNSSEYEIGQSGYEKVMEAMKDEKVGMIGLYGMGGCGKTTLAAQVGNKAHAEKLFDKVIFVPVSMSVNVRTIQDKIASSLWFEFPSYQNNGRERAKWLHWRLTQEYRILIILDDVWESLNLRDIGIPSSSDKEGFYCKVLITTRSKVVCERMDCQREIHVGFLTDEEAWTLFTMQVQISDQLETPDVARLKEYSRKIILNKCMGLPVAIVAIASALKGRTEVEWKVTLHRLIYSVPLDIEEGLQNPYNCLQLSYDHLDSEEAKSLFLFCSVFPEDDEIPIEYLTRFAVGLGVVGFVRTYEYARSKVKAAINNLLSSCLLLGVDNEHGCKCVKMHNFVRVVAQWIAKKDKNKVIECVLEDCQVYDYPARYLWCHGKHLTNELDCSNLEFLHVKTKLEVSNEIFKGMRKLKVLVLINSEGGYRRRRLSTMSFRSLTNLRYLFLQDWDLSDMSFLGGLRRIEGLSLVSCSFHELPNDFATTKLTEFRLLELYLCDMEMYNFEVISKLTQLEELYIYDPNECSLKHFYELMVPQTLRRHRIHLGNAFDPDDVDERENNLTHQRTLSLSSFYMSNVTIKDLAQKANILRIANIQEGVKNIVPDIFQSEGGGMNHLIELWIRESEEIEYLVDTNSKSLSKTGNNLNSGSFTLTCLKRLRLSSCGKLGSLFTISIAKTLTSLEELSIQDCPNLKHILETLLIKSGGHDFNSEVSMFPSLKTLLIRRCGLLQYVLPITFVGVGLNKLDDSVFPNLKDLSVEDCEQLVYVFDPPPLHNNPKNEEIYVHFPALERLSLRALPKLISIFPTNSLHMTWPSLNEFELYGCPEFMKDSLNDLRVSSNSRKPAVNANKEIKGAQRHFLTLKPPQIHNSILKTYFHNTIGQEVSSEMDWESQPQMSICMGLEFPLSFQNLQELGIQGCGRLQVIFPSLVLRCLPELKWLEISECKELKQIVDEDGMENENLSNLISVHPQPCFPKLQTLIIKQCQELKRLFSASTCNDLPRLEVLIISEASGLEQLVGCKQGKGYDIGEPKLELPNLKFLVFRHLSSLHQGTELQTVRHRVVHNCPKLLSLTSAASTPREFKKGLSSLDLVISWSRRQELLDYVRQLDHYISDDDYKSQAASRSELPSSQKEWDAIPENASQIQMDHGDPATSGSDDELSSKHTNQPIMGNTVKKASEEHNQVEGRATAPESFKFLESNSENKGQGKQSMEEKLHSVSSPNLTLRNENTGKENVHEDAISEEATKVTLSADLEGPTLADSVVAHIEARDEKMLPQDSQVVVPHPVSTTSHSDPSESQSRSYPLNLVDQESIRERNFLDKQFVPKETINIENREEESIQEGPTFEKDSLEGLSLGGIAPNHNEFNGGEILAQDSQIVEEDNKPNDEGSNLTNKEGGIGVIVNDRNEIHQGSDRSQSLIIAKLGECKHFVDMDDAQIALLAEAISAYPHLWNLCEKFSGRFQAWMLKTLADMLLFLRNESVISVTPQRLKDFHRLCDESAQFGFERSWIDEMRQRVMDKDPEIDSAQAQISELLQRHEQLTRELVEIKGKLNRLNDFVAARKKCFDFL